MEKILVNYAVFSAQIMPQERSITVCDNSISESSAGYYEMKTSQLSYTA